MDDFVFLPVTSNSYWQLSLQGIFVGDTAVTDCPVSGCKVAIDTVRRWPDAVLVPLAHRR